MLALVAERKKTAAEFPNLVDYEASARSCTSTMRRRCPPAGSADRGRARHPGPVPHQAREDRAPVPALERRGAEAPQDASASACRACSTCTRPAPFFRAYFEALGPRPSTNVVFSDAHERGDVGRGRQVRLDRPVLPEQGGAGAHPQPALPPARAGAEARSSTTSSSRSSRTCRTS